MPAGTSTGGVVGGGVVGGGSVGGGVVGGGSVGGGVVGGGVLGGGVVVGGGVVAGVVVGVGGLVEPGLVTTGGFFGPRHFPAPALRLAQAPFLPFAECARCFLAASETWGRAMTSASMLTASRRSPLFEPKRRTRSQSARPGGVRTFRLRS
jgi:hypothetical protein